MKKFLWLLLLFFGFCSQALALENLFYILRTDIADHARDENLALTSLKKNYQSIDILVPQAYCINADGLVYGYVDREILSFAEEHHLKLMPLVTNLDFDKKTVHEFLKNPAARRQAIDTLLQICAQHHFYGLQMDFEMISLADRDSLTEFYREITQALHQKGFAISFAVAPTVSGPPFHSLFLKASYENWEGAYDLKALGAMADFVTIMTYNQHGFGTTPGPTSAYPWVRDVVQYFLLFMPANKISLGISGYSTYWFTGHDPESSNPRQVGRRYLGLDFPSIDYLIKEYRVHLNWDAQNKVSYAMYMRNEMYEYMFLEDQKSFSAKLALAQDDHLRGISFFTLGLEDPAIWNVLNK